MNASRFFKLVKSNFWAGVLGGNIVSALLLIAVFFGRVEFFPLTLLLIVAGVVVGLIVGVVVSFLFSLLISVFSTQETVLRKTALIIVSILSFAASSLVQLDIAIRIIFSGFAHPGR